MYDVIIVGGGPAGLNAALVLGRCLRRVLVCDSGKPRNAKTNFIHGFLTRDCTPPSEFLTIAREQLNRYTTVEWFDCEVATATKIGDTFVLTTTDNSNFSCRKLLLATGLVDRLPDLPNIEQYYGKSIHHCPYCDAWEVKNQPLVAYGKYNMGVGLALSLKTWSHDITLCTDGTDRISNDEIKMLERNDIKVIKNKIDNLIGYMGQLKSIVLTNGTHINSSAIFFSTSAYQQAKLGKQLNCQFTKKGVIKANRFQQTNTKGLYVAGDTDRDMQQVIIAAAEGVKAAMNINKELQLEERK